MSDEKKPQENAQIDPAKNLPTPSPDNPHSGPPKGKMPGIGEDGYQDYTLSSSLTAIQLLLREEAKLWLGSDSSKTATKIGHYDVAIHLLLQFVRENNVACFVMTFLEYDITIAGRGNDNISYNTYLSF